MQPWVDKGTGGSRNSSSLHYDKTLSHLQQQHQQQQQQQQPQSFRTSTSSSSTAYHQPSLDFNEHIPSNNMMSEFTSYQPQYSTPLSSFKAHEDMADGTEVLEFLNSTEYSDYVHGDDLKADSISYISYRHQHDTQHALSEKEKLQKHWTAELLSAEDIVEYLLEANYSEDIYGIPVLGQYIKEAKEELKENNTERKAVAVERLTMIRNHLVQKHQNNIDSAAAEVFVMKEDDWDTNFCVTPLISKVKSASYLGEFKWLFKNCIPIVFTCLMQNSLQMASVFTIGHLGPTKLAAAALSTMFANVTAWSIAFGTAAALDTLCSQAWTGAKDKTLVGVHLQRALCILSLMFIPIAIVWWNCTDILLKLNQEPELAFLAGQFLRYLMLGAPAFIAFEATKKFLQAQGIMQASSYVLMIVSPINLVLNYAFVYLPPFELGYVGAPLATSCSYWLMLILLISYIYFIDGKQAWGGWTRECLTGWWPFLKLSIPSLLMITAEWWAFEVASLAASYISTIDLAAQSIVLTTASATYTIPFGISIAASNRIGNALGEANASKARIASVVSILFAIFFGSLNSTFFMACRSKFGYLFTSDDEVVDLVSHIMPLCALFQIADGLSGVCGGVIRGMGRQSIAAWVNLISYYVIALPIGYYLAFVLKWEITGIWVGLTLALFLTAAGCLIFLFRTNWTSEVEKTQMRVKLDEDKIHEDMLEH